MCKRHVASSYQPAIAYLEIVPQLSWALQLQSNQFLFWLKATGYAKNTNFFMRIWRIFMSSSMQNEILRPMTIVPDEKHASPTWRMAPSNMTKFWLSHTKSD